MIHPTATTTTTTTKKKSLPKQNLVAGKLLAN